MISNTHQNYVLFFGSRSTTTRTKPSTSSLILVILLYHLVAPTTTDERTHFQVFFLSSYPNPNPTFHMFNNMEFLVTIGNISNYHFQPFLPQNQVTYWSQSLLWHDQPTYFGLGFPIKTQAYDLNHVFHCICMLGFCFFNLL
jgi:hypothetical protein